MAQASIAAHPLKPSARIRLNRCASIPPSAITGALASRASAAARILGSGIWPEWLRVGNSGEMNSNGTSAALRDSRAL